MAITISDAVKPAVEKLEETEKEDLFISLLMGKDATGTVETKYGSFTVKYPKEKDKIAIGRLMSINRGGLPAASFDIETENRNLICSTLNVVVTQVPPKWEKIKKEKPNWSFEEAPDDAFLMELYRKAGAFRDEVQRNISEGKGATARSVSTGESIPTAVETGAFDGLDGSSEA